MYWTVGWLVATSGAWAVEPVASQSLALAPGFERQGNGVSVLKDVDADGYDDVLIVGEWRADVYRGGPSGPETTPWSTVFWPEGVYAYDIAVGGDVNGDGFGDLAIQVYDVDGQWVELRYGSSSGYGPTADVVFDNAVGVAMADVDGDTVVDVVVGYPSDAQGGQGELALHLGGGAGVSPTPDDLRAGPFGDPDFGKDIAVGDTDGDGLADVVTTREYGVDVVFGSPAGWSVGTFPLLDTVFLPFHAGYHGRSTAVADVDGDGFDDVVTYYGTVFRGGPAGPASSPSYRTRLVIAQDVAAVGDVDGDGFDDVAFAQNWSLDLFSAANTTTFEDPSQVDGLHLRVSGGDVNGDGYGDLLYGSVIDAAAGLAFGGPTGPDPANTVRWEPRGREVLGANLRTGGDLSGDGIDDLVITHGERDDEPVVRVVEGSAAGLVRRFGRVFPGQEANVCDVRGDEHPELVVVVPDGPTHRLGLVEGTFGGLDGFHRLQSSIGYALEPRTLPCGDADGDGFLELASHRNVGNRARPVVFRGAPGGWSSPPDLVGPAADVAPRTWADVDGDGYDDLLLTKRIDGAALDTLVVLVAHGGARGLSLPVEVERLDVCCEMLLPSTLAAGDWNGDGYDDVAVLGVPVSDLGTQSHVVFGSATGLDVSNEQLLGGLPLPAPTHANRADVTGDGIEDLVLGYASEDQVLVVEGATAGLGTAPLQLLEGESGEGFGAGLAVLDVDDDGELELVVLADRWMRGTGRLHVHEL